MIWPCMALWRCKKAIVEAICGVMRLAVGLCGCIGAVEAGRGGVGGSAEGGSSRWGAG